MIAAIGYWQVIEAGVIMIGIAVIVGMVGLSFWLYERERTGRPIIPFGARMRVERQKAHTEILGEHLKQDAVEVKRLALGHQRDAVLNAIKNDDTPAVMALGLPSGETSNGKIEDAVWAARVR